MDDQHYHQRNGSHNSSTDSKSTKDETFVADSNVTGCDKCSCNGKGESKSTEDDEQNNTPPGIGFSVAMCHPLLSQEADGFQLLVDTGSSRHFIEAELIRGVETRMQDLEYIRIEPPIEITAAGNNVLRGTAQGILLVVVRGTDDALRTVKLPTVLVPELQRNLFSNSAAAKKGVKTIIEQEGSSLDLGAFSVQLTRLDSMEYRDLTIAKERRRTKSALCTIAGKIFRKEAVLTALVPKKSIAQPVGSIKVHQKVGGKQDKGLTYKIQENTNEVSCREKIESKYSRPTIGDADKVSNSSIVSCCEQTRSNALLSTSTMVNNILKRMKMTKTKGQRTWGQKAQIRSQATINQIMSTTG